MLCLLLFLPLMGVQVPLSEAQGTGVFEHRMLEASAQPKPVTVAQLSQAV